MNAGRERTFTVAACVVGSLLALFASGRQWASAVVVEPSFPHVTVHVAGRTVAPAVAGLALVGLAGAIAMLATRGVARVVTGVLVLLAGAGIVAQSVRAASDVSAAIRPSVASAIGRTGAAPATVDGSVWPWVAVTGGVLVAVAGLLAAVRGRRWPTMSRRYESGSGAVGRSDPTRAEDPADAMWKALDRGEDPTDSGPRDTDPA